MEEKEKFKGTNDLTEEEKQGLLETGLLSHSIIMNRARASKQINNSEMMEIELLIMSFAASAYQFLTAALQQKIELMDDAEKFSMRLSEETENFRECCRQVFNKGRKNEEHGRAGETIY